MGGSGLPGAWRGGGDISQPHFTTQYPVEPKAPLSGCAVKPFGSGPATAADGMTRPLGPTEVPEGKGKECITFGDAGVLVTHNFGVTSLDHGP